MFYRQSMRERFAKGCDMEKILERPSQIKQLEKPREQQEKRVQIDQPYGSAWTCTNERRTLLNKVIRQKVNAKKKRGTPEGAALRLAFLAGCFYLPAISKLTLASSFPFTVTFWLVLPSFSCQTSTV
jgi:hypothetical protein